MTISAARIAVFPGDGIGPEVIAEARAVLDRCAAIFDFDIEWAEGCVGGGAIERSGTALPEESLALARASDAVLLGAVGGPQWDDPRRTVRPEQALLGLRKELDLFANLRPIRASASMMPATVQSHLVAAVDILFVRELTSGLYYGQPSERREGPEGREAVDTLCYREDEIARVTRLAFSLARQRRRQLTSVDKANILATSRLWREIVAEVAGAYPDVQQENILVDAMAMHLLRRPRDFDVVVTENLFGDILTDEAAVLIGSLGMLPSASIGDTRNRFGERFGLYEPVHGSAPDIVGREVANPLGAILSAAMLLEYSLGRPEAARAVEAAVERALGAGLRTADIRHDGCRVVSTREIGSAVRERLEC